MTKLFVTEGYAKDWKQAISISANILVENGCVKEEFFENCVKREMEYPTGLTEECPVAIPHTNKEYIYENSICFVRLKKPVAFRRMDAPDIDVYVDFVINMAFLDDNDHIVTISKILNSITNPQYIELLRQLSIEDFEDNLREHLI